MSQLVPISHLCPQAALSEHCLFYLLYCLASHSEGIDDCQFFLHFLVAFVCSILPSVFLGESTLGAKCWLGLNGCVPPQFLHFW